MSYAPRHASPRPGRPWESPEMRRGLAVAAVLSGVVFVSFDFAGNSPSGLDARTRPASPSTAAVAPEIFGTTPAAGSALRQSSTSVADVANRGQAPADASRAFIALPTSLSRSDLGDNTASPGRVPSALPGTPVLSQEPEVGTSGASTPVPPGYTEPPRIAVPAQGATPIPSAPAPSPPVAATPSPPVAPPIVAPPPIAVPAPVAKRPPAPAPAPITATLPALPPNPLGSLLNGAGRVLTGVVGLLPFHG